MKTIVCALAMGSLLICGACSSKPAAGETAEGADSTAVTTDSAAVTDEAALPETPEAAKAKAEAIIAELQAALDDDTKGEKEINAIMNKYRSTLEELKAADKEKEREIYGSTVAKFIDKNFEKLQKKGMKVEVKSTIVFTAPKIIEDKKDAAVETAKEKVNDAKAKAAEKVEEAKQQAREKANEKVDEAAEKAKEQLNKKLGL